MLDAEYENPLLVRGGNKLRRQIDVSILEGLLKWNGFIIALILPAREQELRGTSFLSPLNCSISLSTQTCWRRQWQRQASSFSSKPSTLCVDGAQWRTYKIHSEEAWVIEEIGIYLMRRVFHRTKKTSTTTAIVKEIIALDRSWAASWPQCFITQLDRALCEEATAVHAVTHVCPTRNMIRRVLHNKTNLGSVQISMTPDRSRCRSYTSYTHIFGIGRCEMWCRIHLQQWTKPQVISLTGKWYGACLIVAQTSTASKQKCWAVVTDQITIYIIYEWILWLPLWDLVTHDEVDHLYPVFADVDSLHPVFTVMRSCDRSRSTVDNRYCIFAVMGYCDRSRCR